MDTVQMNKKIKEIMDSSDFYLLSEDAAKAIGVAPQKLREQAKDEPEKIGIQCNCSRHIYPYSENTVSQLYSRFKPVERSVTNGI